MEDEIKVKWPQDAKPLTGHQIRPDTPIMSADLDNQDDLSFVTFEQLSESVKEIIEITGQEIAPLEGGETSGTALSVPAGPTGEVRTADVASGKWYNFGSGAVEATTDKRWRAYWNGTTWSLVDMGELPNAPVVDNLESESETEALSAKQGKLLNEKITEVEGDIPDVSGLATKTEVEDIDDRTKDIDPVGDNEFLLIDADGNVAHELTHDGITRLGRLRVEQDVEMPNFVAEKSKLIENSYESTSSDEKYANLTTDEDGNILFGVEKSTGKIISIDRFKNISSDFLNKFEDVNMVISYGQSLSNGTVGRPALDTVQMFDSLMFNGGVIIDPNSIVDDSLLATFVPLIESDKTVAGGNLGQTVLSTVFNSVIKYIEDTYRLKSEDKGFQFLGVCTGKGEQTVANLQKGSTMYTNTIKSVQAAKDICDAEGKTFKVLAIPYIQGENNNNTPYATYKSSLLTLLNDLNTDIKAITGQLDDVFFIFYQNGSFYNYILSTSPTANLVQLELATDEPEKYGFSNPMFRPFYSYASDATHLTNIGYKQFGVDIGKSLIRKFVDAEISDLISYEAVSYKGRTITIKCNGVKSGLVVDSENISLRENFGFRLFNSENTEILIESVSIVKGHTIKIVAESEIEAEFYLTYAINGTNGSMVDNSNTPPQGNIRDGEVFATRLKNFHWKSYNWLPINRITF